ncbi:MAG: glycosyltransferase family 1 protein [Acidimicrobiales bacterium]
MTAPALQPSPGAPGEAVTPGEAATPGEADKQSARHGRLAVALDATPLIGTQTGVGVFCHEAMTALAASGELDVSGFAISWRRRYMLDKLVPPGAKVVGRAMPARPLHLAWRHFEMPSIERFIGEVDVVHGTNFVVPPTRKAARVVTVHDLTPVLYPEMCEPANLRFPALIRRALAYGAWVHTPSRYVADEVIAVFGADPSKVKAVHHGAPRLRTTDPIRIPEFPHFLPQGTSRYVLAIGTTEPRKDLPGLVKAFDAIAEDFPDTALVLAGKQGWGAGELDQAIELARHANRIVLPGYVDDLDSVLANATVLAYPSIYEGFGLPTLEAMAAGIPVVTTTAGALPEVVGDAAVMVPPKDTDALSGAIAKLLTDESTRLDLIKRGLERASLFTWEKCAAGLTDLYRDAVADRR